MLRLKVEKMGCGGCAKSVTGAVQAVEPGARVEVDLSTKLVTVSGTTAPADRIAQAIAAAGYPAEPVLASSRRRGNQTFISAFTSQPRT